MMNEESKIKITWDDVKNVNELDPAPLQSEENKTWGTITGSSPIPNVSALNSSGSILLKGWFYLGAAGLLGAFLAWLICEPAFEDSIYSKSWGNVIMFPLMAILMCVSLGTVESFIERSWRRGLLRGLASLGLGLILGFLFFIVAEILFKVFTLLLLPHNATSRDIVSNPLFWVSRGFAWASFGIAGGLIFGIVSKSGKKITYGILGGIFGGFIGGLLFDPISLIAQGAEASRAIGMSILGASTGIAIGLVESALKERWLYVSSGPLAGKQFVLYQDIITIGKAQTSTIFLFKDPSILEYHATITLRTGKSFLSALGSVVVSGQSILPQMQHMLRTGDIIQIGRYVFSYAEKERTSRV